MLQGGAIYAKMHSYGIDVRTRQMAFGIGRVVSCSQCYKARRFLIWIKGIDTAQECWQLHLLSVLALAFAAVLQWAVISAVGSRIRQPEQSRPFETGTLSAESRVTGSGTDSSGETEIEPIGSYAVDDEPVLTINDTTVYLSEINARAYMARDQYVADYGEEPWDTKMDNGMTVVSMPRATMLDEIERAVILCNKADEYDVQALTDDEEKQCASKAEDYMASIGEDIAAQFSVEQSAVLAIYEKDALSMKVYNQILENLSETLRQEDDYKDMEDSEFEQVLNDKLKNSMPSGRIHAKLRQQRHGSSL